MSLVTFAAQHRNELLSDLRMMPSIACPTCAIHYVNNEWEDTCNTDCCQYEFEEPTSDAEIFGEWKVDALREMYRTGGIRLFLKWAERFGCRSDKEILLDTLGYRRIYENYDLEEMGRILDVICAANIRIDNHAMFRSHANDAEYALLCSRFPE